PKTSYEVQTQLAGAYNVENVLCAIAVGTYFGLHASEINEGIRSYKPSNNRSQVVDSFRGNRIIGDYYNANASSMNAALTSFSKLVDHRAKVLILGDMFEMGDVSAEEHQRVLEKAMELDCSRNLFIGQAFHHQKTWMEQQGTRFEKTLKRLEFYPSLQDAKTILKRNPIRDSLILLKGSRGVALEG